MFFFFNDTATTEIYTLSLHDALPISRARPDGASAAEPLGAGAGRRRGRAGLGALHPLEGLLRPRRRPADRKSTRLNSSHANISYAVFCLKKKQKTIRVNSNTSLFARP